MVVVVKAMMATFQERGRKNPGRVWPALLCLFAPVILILAFSINAYCANPAITISSVPMAIIVAGNAGSLGTNLNAFGLGTPATGVSVIAPVLTTPTFPITGTYYYSPINLKVTGLGGTGALSAYASTNFTHPAAFAAYICTSGCTASSGYGNALSLNSAAPTPIAAAAANNSTTEVYIAVLVAPANGSAASTGGWAGADSVVITFSVTDSATPHKTGTQTFTVNLTSQTAVGLWLSAATGGLGVTTASDFAMNFSTVNGLGIGPAAGLTTKSVSGGYVYCTPYTITPVFSGFNTVSTNGTVTVQLQTAFGSPTMIYLEDSASCGGPFSQITGTAITVSSAASSNTGLTRYLGLFVSNFNGTGAFTGSDSSSLTYTLTAP